MHISCSKGEVCDSKLKAAYKLDNIGEKVKGFSDEEHIEVTICREQEIDQKDLISKYKNWLVLIVIKYVHHGTSHEL